jgi:serine/threonine protein phosphatase PrpC
MAEFVVRVGGHTAQGKRSNNEDCFVVDPHRHVFLVADGMGGQDKGEEASRLAADIIPREICSRLAAQEQGPEAVRHAMDQAHRAILEAGKGMSSTKRMGTTAVLAVQCDDRVYVAGVGDSPAFLVRQGKVEQLTVDHTVADALARNGAITPDQAKVSPFRNVLYKFLGCAEMADGPDIRPFEPQAGDRLILASDGLSGFITPADLLAGVDRPPQQWAEELVALALERGSNDNVTCVVVAFEAEAGPRSGVLPRT